MENRKSIIIVIITIIIMFALPIITVAQSYKYLSSTMQHNISTLGDASVASLPVPVLFGVEIKDISPNFGDARAKHPHQGEDIMAPKGTPVVSPTAAVVLGVETGPISGNMVYTANPGGETFYYIHLDRFGEGVSVGKVLEPGSLIGYVGNTGDAAGGAAHLHFQINNKLDVPDDPFPRLTVEFTSEQKISFLNTILAKTADADLLLKFLKKTFPKTFTADFVVGISLPSDVVDFVTSTSAPNSNEGLDIGSIGDEVVALQKYLIQANSGSQARILKNYGATGKFGALTKAALVEWQKAKRILPATGHYGSKSQAYITAHSFLAQNTKTTTSKIASITRELYEGISGADVLTLQKILNAKGYIVAKTGLGSPGNETNYFGLNTREAVKKFQIAKKISPAEGNVGPKTIAALASL
ncbi:MAG: peptidoglycan-binding protein [Candidatus Staskawiczbacteria bacterium]|nr:peptidoglycan-binding protein [Candidatus Staskawiczbacteria bacterium]